MPDAILTLGPLFRYGVFTSEVLLTDPGLAGIVAAVKEGCLTFQRILTYALNSVTKRIVQLLFLGAGLVETGHAIRTRG